MIYLAIRGGGRRLRELSIVNGFDAARIRGDAESGKAKSLSEYLDELLPDSERMERGFAKLAANLDVKIARQKAREERKQNG